MSDYIKMCPECNKEQQYENKYVYLASLKKNTLCYSCSNRKRVYSEETRKKMSAWQIKTYQRKQDILRQSRIIQYFETIGNPLNQFVRVDATTDGKLGIAVVYRKPEQTITTTE
jgi:hypothetical protein